MKVHAAVLAALVAAKSLSIRGADPAKLSLLESPNFRCLDGSSDRALVNDDYCDCDDGSDEPGTSACYNGTFYCANAGYQPALLPSSRVDDGVCDPQCCDGSDESPGTCQNVCRELAIKEKERAEALELVRKLGAKAKLLLLEKAATIRTAKIKELASVQKSLPLLRAAESEARKTKEQLEVKEPDYQDDPPEDGAKEGDEKKSILGLLAGVKDTILASIGLKQNPKIHEPPSTDPPTSEAAADIDALSPEELALVERLKEERKLAIKVFRESLEEARRAYSEAERTLSQATSTASTLEQELKNENGKNNVYLSLRDTCLEYKEGR
ncbi:hypothetical protein HDU91_002790 [Kappamyces sp. JEL0680]|nr:hypothetical protein HDU91_002790 [Kappamyces sp. JEL0680]